MSVEHGGKPNALNAGINMARSPYFCTVDADSIIERDALLRLMAPVVQSSQNTVVSGGIVRIANGCTVQHGGITDVSLAPSWLERCQTVEYIRTFLFGRPGWNALNATFITSGAFCLLHKQSVIEAGGFSRETVTEDIDMIATLRRYLTDQKRQVPHGVYYRSDLLDRGAAHPQDAGPPAASLAARADANGDEEPRHDLQSGASEPWAC